MLERNKADNYLRITNRRKEKETVKRGVSKMIAVQWQFMIASA